MARDRFIPMRISLIFLGVLLLGNACREPAPRPTSLSPEEAQRAAFKELNSMLVRIDEHLAQLNDPELKTAAQASADVLKQRRDALRANFSAAAYDELLHDAALDVRRLAAWVAEELEASRRMKKK
jgi:hypothetical protein